MMAAEDEVIVEVLKCASHGVAALSINDVRVTGAKCCGSWSINCCGDSD